MKRVSPEMRKQTHADETPSDDSVTARQETGVRAIASDFGNDQDGTMDEVPSDDHDLLTQDPSEMFVESSNKYL